ncbi:MAG: hypothetical protein R3A49_08960 [Acidimicrobiia bacterium]
MVAAVFFVAAQLINVVAFSVVRFVFARRVIEKSGDARRQPD